MNIFVANPDWGWWIIWYFFLGGIAAGAYFTATLIDLAAGEKHRELSRLGYWIALPLVSICGILLIADLNRPERFWHMLVRSEVVHEALDEGWPTTARSWELMAGAPLLKHWSPMSIGSWALLLFGFCSGLSWLGSLWDQGRLGWLLRRSMFGRIIQIIGCAVGFFVAAYTGVLLTATNQPLWSDSTWIASLFLASAASTGIASLLVIARLRRTLWGKFETCRETLDRLERADRWVLLLEFAVFALFLFSLGDWLMPVLQTWNGKLLVGGVLLVGILMPLAVHMRTPKGAGTFTAALLALAGGFVLRYAILTTPPELLARNRNPTQTDFAAELPRLIPGFSPEDDRRRGGGPGADPGNRRPEFHPRSKIGDSK